VKTGARLSLPLSDLAVISPASHTFFLQATSLQKTVEGNNNELVKAQEQVLFRAPALTPALLHPASNEAIQIYLPLNLLKFRVDECSS
jgi:hypothetical protein